MAAPARAPAWQTMRKTSGAASTVKTTEASRGMPRLGAEWRSLVLSPAIEMRDLPACAHRCQFRSALQLVNSSVAPVTFRQRLRRAPRELMLIRKARGPRGTWQLICSTSRQTTTSPGEKMKKQFAGFAARQTTPPPTAGWRQVKCIRSAVLGLVAVMVHLAPIPASAQPRVETFVIAVGGMSSCWTFIPPQPVLAFFGGFGVSIPIDGIAACGIAGTMNQTTDPVGPLSDSTSVDTVFGDNSFRGSAVAFAQYGFVSAGADGTYTGSQSSLVVDGADGFGLFKDTFTFRSPSVPDGATGFVRFGATVGGNLFSDQPGTADVEVKYQQNAASIFTLMRAQVDQRFGPFMTPTAAGFTLTPTSVSGSDLFTTFMLPIVYGTPFDFTLGLLASSVPAIGGPITADLNIGAQLTQIEAFDSGGQPVVDFAIASGSGTGYGPGGVQ